MKTGELAKWLGIADITLRQWSANEYREYLSPTGQGGSGRNRVFTDMDARVIAHVVRMKAAGADRDTIHASLKTMQADNWRNLPDMPAAPPDFEPIAMIPREAAENAVTGQRQALMREISLLQDRVDSLVDDLKNERAAKESAQAELSAAREQIGELRGKLATIENERPSSVWWLRLVVGLILGLLILGIVAAVLISAVQ